MVFQPKDRVEHTNVDMKGTVVYDNGRFVQVQWDDGQVGLLEYNRSVHFNAHRIQKLVSGKKQSARRTKNVNR